MILKFQKFRITLDSGRKRDPLACALRMLLRAYRFAVETQMDPWQYAVEIEELRLAGVSISELRLLVFMGVVFHGQELANPSGDARRFMLLPKNAIPAKTCFVLSPQGAKAFHQHSSYGQAPSAKSIVRAEAPALDLYGAPPALAIPIWLVRKQELLFDRLIVKRFRQPALNQQTILNAFQEELWAIRIDDPLPPAVGQDSRRKLNDTIKCLNRHQANPLISFRGDGSGRGVLWESRSAKE